MRATGLLANVGWTLSPIAHVVVDEVQDVVGIRARFVLQLLDVLVGLGAGFTLLGDPLQAIYDFQLVHETMTCTDLIDEARTRFFPVDHPLEGEYRTRSDETRAAATARSTLQHLDPDDRLRRLEALTVDLPPLGAIDVDAVADLTHWQGTTALLCDTNIRAALVAQHATHLGLPVAIAPDRDDPTLPCWIAALLQNHPRSTVTREEFFGLSADAVGDAPDRWRLLINVARARRHLPLRDLGIALQSAGRSRALDQALTGKLIASTVHRAKGLEFDNVVLVDPDRWDRRDDQSPDAASRRLFVALTRARLRLTRVRGIDTRGWSREHPSGIPVWVKRPPRVGRRGRPTTLLIEPWMAQSLGPTTADLARKVGLPLTWDRTDEHITVDGDVLPSWTAAAGGTPIVRTGEAFGQIVAKLIDSTLTRLPNLTGGHVEGVETVVGPPTPSGPGCHGFWTGARIAGTLTFVGATKGPS